MYLELELDVCGRLHTSSTKRIYCGQNSRMNDDAVFKRMYELLARGRSARCLKKAKQQQYSRACRRSRSIFTTLEM